MITAIILMKVERKKINDVAERLAEIHGISEVYSVSGNFDLVAVVRVRTNEDLSELVTTRLAHVDFIEKTETMLAFKTHSKHDLEAMFSLGM